MNLKKFILSVLSACFVFASSFSFEQKKIAVMPLDCDDISLQSIAKGMLGPLKSSVNEQKVVVLITRSDVDKILDEMHDQQTEIFEAVKNQTLIKNVDYLVGGTLTFDSASQEYTLSLQLYDLSATCLSNVYESEKKGSQSLNNLVTRTVNKLFNVPSPKGSPVVKQSEKSKTVTVSWNRASNDKNFEYMVVYSESKDDLTPYFAEIDARKGTDWIAGRKATFDVPDENITYFYTVLVKNQLGVQARYDIVSSSGKVETTKSQTTSTPQTNTATTNASKQNGEEKSSTAKTSTASKKIMKAEDFKYVEGGTFQMGSTSGDSDEKPVHTVRVSSFYMCDHEVTQKEYRDVMGTNPSKFSGDNLPVERVSWYNAVEYCNKLSIKEGLTPYYTINDDYTTCNFNANGYRLPTEAEWEYAARGGKKSNGYTYAGSNSVGNVAWYYDNSGSQTHNVKTKAPNELGLYDMSGNVWEWCWDWYGNYSSGSQTNPSGSSSDWSRVLRGGSWGFNSSCCRVADRFSKKPSGTGSEFVGFRVVRNASK